MDSRKGESGGRPASAKRHLVKAAGLVGGLTLCSRVLGMFRDVVSARSFGTSWQWDGFIYAFMIPNFFRRLVGEGALSSAFIPVYNDTLQGKGRDAAFRFANTVLTLLAVVLIVFLAVVEIGLYGLLKVSAFSSTVHLTFDLLRFFFPYLWLMSFYALGMGVLHSHKRFFAPAVGPILLNLFWIFAVLYVIPHAGSDMSVQVRWLALVILGAGFFQLAVELPPLFRLGFRLRWIWDVASAELKKSLNLLLPIVLSFAVVQINVLIDMTLALVIGPGANSSLWYGNRLMQFPLGIFAIAMGTALLPTISAQAARRETEEAKNTLGFALRNIFLIVLPASIGLMVLSTPMIRLLFERGHFDAVSTARSSAVLFCYALGLFAYSGQKIITTGFYAVQDTKTPVKIAISALVLNVILNLILMIPFREAGLALATSIAGVFQFSLLLFFCQRKVVALDMKGIFRSFAKILAAALSMGLATYWIYQALRFCWGAGDWVSMGLVLLGSILISGAVYFVLCLAFRVHEVKEVVGVVLRRGGNNS